jgi:nitrite reductase/ring-hydroxylating ferredoxin subunit
MKPRCSSCKHCTIDEIADGENKVVFHSHCGKGRSVMFQNRTDAERAFVDGCSHYSNLYALPFWKPEIGENTIRVIQPDNIVECLDNTGIEDGFDVGVEYVFEGRHGGEMISVYDKIGALRECFSSRFRVKSSEVSPLYAFTAKLFRPVPSSRKGEG